MEAQLQQMSMAMSDLQNWVGSVDEMVEHKLDNTIAQMHKDVGSQIQEKLQSFMLMFVGQN